MELDTRLTTVEAAAVAGVSRGTILQWIHKGYLGDSVEKQSVTRGQLCGYRIEISALNRFLYRRHFGYDRVKARQDKSKEIDLELCMDIEELKRTRRKLLKVIEKAQRKLDEIESML